MRRQDVVIGILVIIVFVGGLLLIRRFKGKVEPKVIPTQTPSVEARVSDRFGGLTIPTDLDRADLTGSGGAGIATRDYKSGRFELTVLGDLPEPEPGTFYQAWIIKGKLGEPGAMVISASKLRLAKGGYLAEFTASEDYTGYNTVIVTSEKNFDQSPENTVLEGSF